LASLKFDPKAKALYVKLGKGKVACTEPLNDSVFVDLDQNSNLIGIEVILPRDLPAETVKKITTKAVAR